MPPNNRRPSGLWVPLAANYFMDEAIIEAGNAGELVYLRSMALAKLINRRGVINRSQMAPLMRRVRRFDDVHDALVETKLWVSDGRRGDVRLRSWEQHNPTPEEEESFKEQARVRQQRHRAKVKPEPEDDVSRVTSLIESREEKKEGSNRTPTGSVRLEPPSAAPRGTGGAAQPPGPSDGVRSEVAAARNRIADARKNMKAAGREFSFRRQPDNSETMYSTALQKLSEMAERMAEPESDSEQ